MPAPPLSGVRKAGWGESFRPIRNQWKRHQDNRDNRELSPKWSRTLGSRQWPITQHAAPEHFVNAPSSSPRPQRTNATRNGVGICSISWQPTSGPPISWRRCRRPRRPRKFSATPNKESRACRNHHHKKRKSRASWGRGFLFGRQIKSDRATSQLLPELQPCRRAGGNRLASSTRSHYRRDGVVRYGLR